MSSSSIPGSGGLSLPNTFSGTTSGTSGTGSTNSPNTFIPLDSLSGSSTPNYLQLFTSSGVNLPEGQISLLEFAQVVGVAKQQLKEVLQTSEMQDTTVINGFYSSSQSLFSSLIEDLYSVLTTVNNWDASVNTYAGSIASSFSSLQSQQSSFNSSVSQTESRDQSTLNFYGPAWINEYIDIYQKPARWNQWTQQHFNNDQNAALNWFNANVIGFYNGQMSGRPNLQQSLNDYTNNVNNYNSLINSENSQISSVNDQRAQNNLPPLTSLSTTPTYSSSITSYLSYEGQVPSSLPYVGLPPNSTSLNKINVSPSPSNITQMPAPVDSGPIPRNSVTEALDVMWIPSVLEALSFMSSFNRIIDLGKALINDENTFYSRIGLNIIFPGSFIAKKTDTFTASISSSGLVSGLAAFALGFGSKNLQIALSNSILSSIASNQQMPLTGRLFGRLELTAIELLQKSALLAALPAFGLASSGSGIITGTDRTIQAAVSLGIVQQVQKLIQSEVVRSLVNGQINQLPAYALLRVDASKELVANGLQQLNIAKTSGNPLLIEVAVANLANAEIQLSRATELYNALGDLSIGGLASFTNAVSATMSLSILSVALAQLGRSIGMPDLVAQLIGNASGAPISELLGAMIFGGSINDVLDNPFSTLALKQALFNVLAGTGMDNARAAQLADAAVNNLVLKGGISSFGVLKSLMQKEFLSAGLDPMMANALANEAALIVQGDLGANFLNAAYQKNFDNKQIGSAVSADAQTQSVIDSINQSFETQREYRDAVYNKLREIQVSAREAMYLANSIAEYALKGELTHALSKLAMLSTSVVSKLTGVLGISAIEANEIFDLAKARALERGPFSNPDQFYAVLREELGSAVNGGSQIFDSARSDLASPSQLLSLSALAKQITDSASALLTPELGARATQNFKDQVLVALLGNISIHEMGKVERQDPLSILSKVEQALSDLKKSIQADDIKKINSKVAEMVSTWLKPNAEMGFLLQSIMDGPSTFVGNAVDAQKASGVNLQIQV